MMKSSRSFGLDPTVSMVPVKKPLLETVKGIRQPTPPIWMMRQAGRYLPEYRAVRAAAGSFLDLCYTPELAAEVTLQPLRRFDLDAAIIFSDILVIPDALGQEVRYETGEGPVLGPLDISALKLGDVLGRLNPVLEALERVRGALAPDKALIGFCGAPWTVATYMIGGRGSPDQAKARQFALSQPSAFASLIDVLVDASVAYLSAQLQAGADVVQIFDSWASMMDEQQFAEWVCEPTRRIVAGVREQVPDAPIIGFPRAAGVYAIDFVEQTGVSALGLDQSVPMSRISDYPAGLPLQGNLDPMRLVIGGEQLDRQVRHIVNGLGQGARPHVFNLGHGIVPETPVAHVERMIQAVREG